MLLCLAAGALVLWIIMGASKPVARETHPMLLPGAYVGQSARLISSRIAMMVGDSLGDAPLVPAKNCKTVNDSVPFSGESVVVADAKKSKEDKEAWKAMEGKEKEDLGKATKDFIASKDTLAVMIFAPWCPHCKTVLPKIAEMGAKMKDKKILLVNAEALERKCFDPKEADAIFPLKYFPTFLMKQNGGALEESSIAKIEETLVNDAPAPAVSAQVASARKATFKRRRISRPRQPPPGRTSSKSQNQFYFCVKESESPTPYPAFLCS